MDKGDGIQAGLTVIPWCGGSRNEFCRDWGVCGVWDTRPELFVLPWVPPSAPPSAGRAEPAMLSLAKLLFEELFPKQTPSGVCHCPHEGYFALGSRLPGAGSTTLERQGKMYFSIPGSRNMGILWALRGFFGAFNAMRVLLDDLWIAGTRAAAEQRAGDGDGVFWKAQLLRQMCLCSQNPCQRKAESHAG